MSTIVSSSQDFYFRSEDMAASHSSMEISTVREAGLPIGKGVALVKCIIVIVL